MKTTYDSGSDDGGSKERQLSLVELALRQVSRDQRDHMRSN
jgi:hypothetical protein